MSTKRCADCGQPGVKGNPLTLTGIHVGWPECIANLKATNHALTDLAKNVAGFDDSLLLSADVNLLRATLREFREHARSVLEGKP
jgi:hypothetical protein